MIFKFVIQFPKIFLLLLFSMVMLLSTVVFMSCEPGSGKALAKYHNQIVEFRKEFRAKEMPDVKFFLFGMGNREKLLYKNGILVKSLTSEILQSWPVKSEIIIPNAYRVEITTTANEKVVIFENEKGVFLTQNGKTKPLDGTTSLIHLPTFQDHKYSEVLKVLHQEILVNIVNSKPVPNYFVYKNPWRRDAAMMAMCLQMTGNLDLIRDWVINLDDPYDHNNGSRQGAPENEADNLGQTLYLLSLFADKSHPLVGTIMAECDRIRVNEQIGSYIKGRSDFQEVPVYQTKWLKYGLQKMGFEDAFTIPMLADNYSSLFWWDYKEFYVETEQWTDDKYPYIGWARDHFFNRKSSPISNRYYPLTWEIEASEADYNGMKIIDEIYVINKNSSPHTWHAAEVFLYLLAPNLPEQ